MLNVSVLNCLVSIFPENRLPFWEFMAAQPKLAYLNGSNRMYGKITARLSPFSYSHKTCSFSLFLETTPFFRLYIVKPLLSIDQTYIPTGTHVS